jgi:hypothetical protein
MSVSVFEMSVSLDGYIADPNDYLGGRDGYPLVTSVAVVGAGGLAILWAQARRPLRRDRLPNRRSQTSGSARHCN